MAIALDTLAQKTSLGLGFKLSRVSACNVSTLAAYRVVSARRPYNKASNSKLSRRLPKSD
jgi:hypothetical protein